MRKDQKKLLKNRYNKQYIKKNKAKVITARKEKVNQLKLEYTEKNKPIPIPDLNGKNTVDASKGKRREIDSTFNYEGVKLAAVEQWCVDKCKHCYFYKYNLDDDNILGCDERRNVKITGTCYPNILFVKAR